MYAHDIPTCLELKWSLALIFVSGVIRVLCDCRSLSTYKSNWSTHLNVWIGRRYSTFKCTWPFTFNRMDFCIIKDGPRDFTTYINRHGFVGILTGPMVFLLPGSWKKTVWPYPMPTIFILLAESFGCIGTYSRHQHASAFQRLPGSASHVTWVVNTPYTYPFYEL